MFWLVQLDKEGLREDSIEVHRIDQGVETCRVGFLQRTYVPHAERYVNKFAQVREVWLALDVSKTKQYMFHQHNHGCCIAGMMGPSKVDGVNDTSYDDNEDDSDNRDDDE